VSKENYLKNNYYYYYYCCLVSLYAPLNNSTYHLIDRAAFDKIKQGTMLINTSRDLLVDAKALVDCSIKNDCWINRSEFTRFFNGQTD